MTPVSLFLSTAGVSLTLISSDRLGACPATQPGSCLIACHVGHGKSRGGGNWTTAQVASEYVQRITQYYRHPAIGESLQSKTAQKTQRSTEGDCLQVLR